MIKVKQIVWLLLLLPIISGCNDSDDVQKIFTGKTWKMTYITQRNDHGWYKFPGVNEDVYESYDPIDGKRAFRIEFAGSDSDDVISGDFNGSGSVSMGGKWSANGKNNEFRSDVKSSSVKDSKDTLGKYIIQGIKNATSYSGDENNLYLYFKDDDGKELSIVFRAEK